MPSSRIYASDPARGWQPWGLLVPFLGILFVIVTALALEFPLMALNFIDKNENPVGLAGFALFLTLPFGALALVVFAWTRFVERRPLAAIGLSRPAAMRFAIGIATGVLLMGAIVAGIWLSGALKPGVLAPAFASPASLAGIALLLACFAIQSSAEEILFRGWMFSALAVKFGTIAGVVVSSLVFMLLHFSRHDPPLFACNIFLFAVFACSWSLRTGNIWGAMGWHSGWNWFLGTGFGLKVTGLDTHLPALVIQLTPAGPVWLIGGDEGSEGSIVCTAVLVAGTAYNLWRRRAADLSTPDSPPRRTHAL